MPLPCRAVLTGCPQRADAADIRLTRSANEITLWGKHKGTRPTQNGSAVLHVDSEVGRLRQVVLHRPDLELKRLTPDNAADLLFDDVLWVSRAQDEHDAFAAVLRSRGVVVHYYSDLLTQTLQVADARESI